ncbi:hypothetical protein [Pedobacter sp. UBA4863]|uniref:hypothetical protein n=1 Tax=Pedobacter sp. UBA4863 TaxID=1947060 RepID=UPI0025DD7363|nr:hypothetical protein [Pedobacter sp. UBA4863]
MNKKIILMVLSVLVGTIQLIAMPDKDSIYTLKQFLTSCWQYKDMVYASRVGRYTQEDAKQFEGRTLCFNSNILDVLGDTIVNSEYSIKEEPTEKFTVRNFQVYKDLGKWFKIHCPSLYVINLKNGRSVSGQTGNGIKAYPYEFAYDGTFLYIPIDGSLFRFEKYKKDTVQFVGEGSVVKEIELTGREKQLHLSYEFFTDADELQIFDQNSNMLHSTGIKSTKSKASICIRLQNVTRIIMKINSEMSKSRWKLWYLIE